MVKPLERFFAWSGQLSLRAKLVGGFSAVIVLTLLVGTVSLLSQGYARSAVESYFGTEDRIADLALKSNAVMLKARRYEKDFLLNVRELGYYEAKSRYATLVQVQMAEIRQNMAAIRKLTSDRETTGETQKVEQATGRYSSGFMQVVALYGVIGRLDSGLEGRFRDKAHEIETKVSHYRDERLMTDLLSLRRREKDFLLRSQERYVQEFAREAEKLRTDIALSRLSPLQKTELAALSASYRDLFAEYARVKSRINTEMAAYLTEVHTIEPMLERLYAHASLANETTRNSVRRLTWATGWIIIVAGLGATMAGLLVAFLISRDIARSVRECMDFAGRIARGELGSRLETGKGKEFAALTDGLNDMADALRDTRLAQELRAAELAESNRALEIEVAERKHTEEALRQRQRAIESSSNGIMITDFNAPDNPVTYVNPAFERITGYVAGEVLGHNSRFLAGNDLEQLGLEEIRAALREQREGSAVLRNYRKDGSLFWNELSVAPVRDENGNVTNYVGILNDVTERKQYEEQLEYQANHDGLTGLPNRNLLADRLGQALSYTDRNRTQAAVLFVDLDHFKFINDSLGHDTGDRLLEITAERLVECVRATDTVARHGGDEFVVVLPDLTNGEDAANIARKIQGAVYQPFKLSDHELMLSCSTGISMYPGDGEDAQTLLKNADAAMYRAKEQGRNSFRFYTSEMNDKAVARMTMESHLRRALERDEFLLHYQPQVDLSSGRVIGMESLIRWQSPELGFISPAQFIPLAEETGLIVPIGEWVMKTSCAQNKAWQVAGFPPLIMAVNLSPRQFRQENLVEFVAQTLVETGLEPEYLELEIIESLIMHDVESAVVVLNELKTMGVQLTIDDFGTGYSSLSYLKRFPFDKLKIDQSFVRNITSDPDNAAIVRAIIAMGHSLNLRLIAEGIETAGELSYLRSLTCDDMQGYYFSRPVPAPAFEQMLREDRHLECTVENDGHDKTLLLVDDDANILASLKRVLCDEGYVILTANSAPQGFDLLALNRVGVIVSDLLMPEINGTEFLSKVRKLYPDAVRILLSGHADLDSLTDTINRGAIYKFLVKPWDEELIRKSIREAFRYRELSLNGA